MNRRLILRPPKLRTAGTEEKERHATWLELFYDLVIVVAVSHVPKKRVRRLTDMWGWRV